METELAMIWMSSAFVVSLNGKEVAAKKYRLGEHCSNHQKHFGVLLVNSKFNKQHLYLK